jgi:DNA-directed RNA polymerase subunit RPC12/RpoP
LRDYVARLKAEKSGTAAKGKPKVAPARLLTIAALHEGFASYFGEKIPLAEFIAHLERLEATDAVHLLVFRTTGAEPHPETLVLLDPTRVDAYASALLVAAKDEPDGPGHLLESRVRDGEFKLDEDERIADRESERQVLWYVMENLLSRDLSLRERIKGEDYLVFPSQCTAELRFPGVAAFGVAFGFSGPVRSIYATLIAQLAHYEGFKKREFFQDAAAYRAEAGGRCLVRLRDHGHGRGELEVSFEGETPASVRQGFLEFVSRHLEAKSNPGSVTKRHAYHCATCRNPFEDRVVKARLDARKKDLLCPICEKKTPLVDLLASPTAEAESVAAQIDIDARAGRRRMTAAFVIKAKEAEGKFDVFLSHNSKDKAAVEKIAKQLQSVGLRPWLDKWNLAGGDTIEDALEQAIKTISCAALCFGPADVSDWHIMEIRAYVAAWAKKKARMIPVILPGVKETPDLPLFVQQTLWVDMRDWESGENDGFYRLVCGILGKAPGDSPLKKFGVRDVAEWQGTGS